MGKQEVPSKLLVPIPDPEKIWLADQEEIQKQEQERQEQERQEQEGDEVMFFTDTIGDLSLQQDYIPFPRPSPRPFSRSQSDDDDSDSNTSGLEDSWLYNSDNDYSWQGRYND
jgi:hypothetical protein